jgi:hypothetical protein
MPRREPRTPITIPAWARKGAYRIDTCKPYWYWVGGVKGVEHPCWIKYNYTIWKRCGRGSNKRWKELDPYSDEKGVPRPAGRRGMLRVRLSKRGYGKDEGWAYLHRLAMFNLPGCNPKGGRRGGKKRQYRRSNHCHHTLAGKRRPWENSTWQCMEILPEREHKKMHKGSAHEGLVDSADPYE